MRPTPIDWGIVAGFLLVFLAMAVYLNAKCRSVADYLVSGRKVRMWLGMGSGIAGEVGLVSIAAMCEQGYRRGFAFVVIGLITMLVLAPLFGVFGFGIERFRATRAMSVPQYIEMRYSRRLRILTGVLNSAAGVFQMSVFPIVGATFVRVLIGAPETVSLGGRSIPAAWFIMAFLLANNVVFTYLGGYLTLVITNFFHMILTLGSLYVVLFVILARDGLQAPWSRLEDLMGVAAFNPFTIEGESYGWIWFLWLLTMSILLQFSYGPYLQKYAAMDRPRTASRSYFFGLLFGNGRTFVILSLGVLALVALGPKPPAGIELGETGWASTATPYYLAQVVPPVLMGFLLAGLLSADTSTTDQYLLSWSTSIVNDCIVPFRRQPFTAAQHFRAVRLTIVGLCVFFFVSGLIYRPTLPIWEYLWLCANIIGGSGIAVLFGMYWSRATTAGAYAAVLANVLVPVGDQVARRIFVATRPEAKYPWEPETTGLAAYALGVLLLILVSLGSRGKTRYWDLGRVVRDMNIGGDR